MLDKIESLVDTLSTVLLGKEESVKLALACLLSNGHLLIEDVPGMGKTTLAHALAQALSLDYRRVQFTSDMLPSDVLGSAVYDTNDGSFRFHPGPVFTQLLLADEINRATPKTQSALLEAMEERQVSFEGETRRLPEPFLVVATQNPVTQYGTYPLPESQLDRFLMRISLGYPDSATERALLLQGDTRPKIERLSPCVSVVELRSLQQQVACVSVAEPVIAYLQRLAHASRHHAEIALGLSPRGVLAILQAAKAWAFMSGRDFVLPDDIQAVFVAVADHRLMLKRESAVNDSMARTLLADVDVLGE